MELAQVNHWAPKGPAHSFAVAPQAGLPSSSYQLLEPCRQYGLGTKGLVPPSTGADSSGTSFFAAHDEHNLHLSMRVPLLLQNLVPPKRAKMAIESAGPLLRRNSQVDSTDHEAVQSGTATTCLQCNDSFKSISELGHHATELQHDAFKCKCGQPFKRLDSLERFRIKYQPGAHQYSCQLYNRVRGSKGVYKRRQPDATSPSLSSRELDEIRQIQEALFENVKAPVLCKLVWMQ